MHRGVLSLNEDFAGRTLERDAVGLQRKPAPAAPQRFQAGQRLFSNPASWLVGPNASLRAEWLDAPLKTRYMASGNGRNSYKAAIGYGDAHSRWKKAPAPPSAASDAQDPILPRAGEPIHKVMGFLQPHKRRARRHRAGYRCGEPDAAAPPHSTPHSPRSPKPRQWLV